MTKHFRLQSAQGDVFIDRIDALPHGIIPAEIIDGVYIVTHSETGHHHVIDSRSAQMFIDQTNAFIAYLNVLDPCELKHLRDFNTHESMAFEIGTYKIHRQREATPAGWRRAQD